MINRVLRNIKSNTGFTLTELLLSMTLAAILTAFLMLFLYHESAVISDIERTESAKVLGDTAIQYMKNELRDCLDIHVYPESSTVASNGVDEKIFHISEGKLFDSSVQVSGGMGNTYTIVYTVKLINDAGIGSLKPMVVLCVQVYDKLGNLHYITEETFENITMSVRGKIFSRSNYGDGSEVGTEIVNPHILYKKVTQENIFS